MLRNLSLVIAVLTVFSLSGCALLLVGGGAAGGYAVSKDSVEGIVDDSKEKVWDVAVKVLEDDGVIKSTDKPAGKIEAEVDDINVDVEITQETKSATKLKISARKYLMPKVKKAQDLYTKMLKKL